MPSNNAKQQTKSDTMRNYQDLIQYQHQQEREQKIIGRIMGFALVLVFFLVLPLLSYLN